VTAYVDLSGSEGAIKYDRATLTHELSHYHQ